MSTRSVRVRLVAGGGGGGSTTSGTSTRTRTSTSTSTSSTRTTPSAAAGRWGWRCWPINCGVKNGRVDRLDSTRASVTASAAAGAGPVGARPRHVEGLLEVLEIEIRCDAGVVVV